MAPPVYVGIVANGANVFLNWLLIFHLGWGFDGAPVVSRHLPLVPARVSLRVPPRLARRTRARNESGGRVLSVSVCFLETVRFFELERTHERRRDVVFEEGRLGGRLCARESTTIATAPRLRLKRNGTRRDARARLRVLFPAFGALAGPGAFMMAIEAWAFEITTLLAGYLGTVPLDAHLTMLQLATLAFLSLPFAVAVAATIRGLSQLLGAGDPRAAKTAGA